MYESEIWDDNPPSLSGGNNTHPLPWFIDRIGKTVYFGFSEFTISNSLSAYLLHNWQRKYSYSYRDNP